MSSWWCGKNVSYDFCVDTASRGQCTGSGRSTGAGNVKSGAVGKKKNDSASRLIMRPYDAAKNGAVTVFSDANCTGYFGRFEALEKVTDYAWYNGAMMAERDIGND